MKRCPRCDRTYSDWEAYCEADGSALMDAEPAFTASGAADDPSEGARECPVCGGKAEPGEIICNFCGARLDASGGGAGAEVATGDADEIAETPRTSPMEYDAAAAERSPARRLFAAAGYAVAAAAALGAGVWLALYLSAGDGVETAREGAPVAAESPAAVAAGPLVALASNTPISVRGEASSAPARSAEAARRLFEEHRARLLDVYERALAGDDTLDDAMLVRVRVKADGTVAAGAVRTSTSPHPGLDAAVVGAMMRWQYAAVDAGEAEIEYPIVFVRHGEDVARLEGALAERIAALRPTDPPEYTSGPGPAPEPVAAATATPPPSRPPEVALAPTPRPATDFAPRKLTRRELAALPTPAPTLLERVQERLRTERRFNRVRAYTAEGTVTLYGKVFDDRDKAAAVRIVRNLEGVSGVVDTLKTDTAEWAEMQSRIQSQLQSAGLEKVTVKVIGRDAYLDGQVKTELERERAVVIAQGAAPVTVRGNLIRVVPGGVFGF